MKDNFTFFIGPCVLESKDLAFLIADKLAKEASKISKDINIVFKGSFDKANRSSIDSYRGPGIDEGLKILEAVKKNYGFNLITDFHTPDQAEIIASVVDYLQVPAFLCRQTDMILEGAKAAQKFDRFLKVKKGQFLSPEDAKNIVDKAKNYLPLDKILLTERGTSFGYNRLVVDMTSFPIMKSFGVKVIHDATHCVQMPGGLGKSTGGMREHIQTLAKCAIVSGADGIFIETHPNPPKALSDAATAFDLDNLVEFIKKLYNLRMFINENE